MTGIRFVGCTLGFACLLGSGCSLQADPAGGEEPTAVAESALARGHHGHAAHGLRHGHRFHHCRHGHSGDEGPRGVAILPDETGWIDSTSNELGVGGPWYGFADGYGPEGARDGSCQLAGHADSECSLLIAPDPAVPGFPNTGGVMCTSGTVTQILMGDSGDYDWANMGWAAIGFNLNQSDTDPGVFDAAAHNVVGFSFDIDEVPQGFRVQVSTPDSPTSYYDYWGAADYYPDSPVVAGKNVVLFSEVQSPEATPVPVDTTQLEAIAFLVTGNPDASVPFDFCISNIEFLVDD